ncbi:MAG: c-type cytochrome, partial [Dehalococcoidia bacterium]
MTKTNGIVGTVLVVALAVLAGCAVDGAAQKAPASGGGGVEPGQVASGRPVDSMVNGGVGFDAERHPGKRLFEQHCANCHLGGVPKAPHREFLEFMPPQAILKALNEGVMRDMAAHLTQYQRNEIAEYLARSERRHWKDAVQPVMCTGPAKEFDLTRPPAEAGWGYDARRFIPGEVAKLTAADLPRLKLKWAFGFPGALRARSQPV